MATVVTNVAKRKMLQARAGIITSFPKIVGMCFGSGGVNSSNAVIDHNASDTALYNERYRQAVDGHTVISDTQIRYTCTLAAATLAGVGISEIGLYDSSGDIIAMKSFLPKYKDADSEMIFECDDTF